MVPRTLAALVLLVLLAGCSGDPEPKIADPTPTSSSSAAAPSPSVSPVAETPEAFIRRWQESSATMQNSGETSAFEALNAPSCTACSRLVDLVKNYYAAGGSVSVTPWTIRDIRPSSANTFIVTMTAGPTQVTASAGADVQQSDGGDGEFIFVLEPVGESWLVKDFQQQAT